MTPWTSEYGHTFVTGEDDMPPLPTLTPVWPLSPRQTSGWWMVEFNPLTPGGVSVTIGEYADWATWGDLTNDGDTNPSTA